MGNMNITNRAREAREASRRILSRTAESRDKALKAVREALIHRSTEIFSANKIDMERSAAEGLAPPLLKRLKFDETKLSRVCEGIEALEQMKDPISRVLEKRELDKELILSRVAGPIGVIGMIFESRPDALVQIATLCLRSGNAVILKGGSEALETNRVLTRIISEASTNRELPQNGQPEGWIQLAETREEVREMLVLDHLIDLLIPRGSNEFVARIMKDSSIPVLGHADGICHVYLDADADPDKAVPIVLDSKMQYVAVCNAAETLLVHSESAEILLPLIRKSLTAAGCELRGCERTRSIINVKPAVEEDWDTEYLDAILSIRIVDNLDEAVEHIHRHGSGHTEAIVTENESTAEAFLSRVDAADVFHNCSTRFADGFVFGLGAEVGISTSKIHARGPVGVDGLLSYRWQLRGTGQILKDYNEGLKNFTHRDL
jgi:glutamate-5-semialdehyde dehydrogenase